MAGSLRPGGIYILGFHLLPPDAAEECIERWTARRGRTRLDGHAPRAGHRPPPPHRKAANFLLVRRGSKPWRLRDEFPLRMYTAAQFRRLLAGVPRLELCNVYDFWYEIDHPLRLSDELSDTVFVLRRKDKS